MIILFDRDLALLERFIYRKTLFLFYHVLLYSFDRCCSSPFGLRSCFASSRHSCPESYRHAIVRHLFFRLVSLLKLKLTIAPLMTPVPPLLLMLLAVRDGLHKPRLHRPGLQQLQPQVTALVAQVGPIVTTAVFNVRYGLNLIGQALNINIYRMCGFFW